MDFPSFLFYLAVCVYTTFPIGVAVGIVHSLSFNYHSVNSFDNVYLMAQA